METRVFSADGASEAITCLKKSNYENEKYDEGWIDFLRYVENFYGCGGFCETNTFYSFTDVRDGPPTKACRDYIILEFSNPFGRIGIFGTMYLISGLLMFSAWYLSFGFCCRKVEGDVVVFNSKIDFF